MAGKKLTTLLVENEKTSLSNDDLVYVVDVSAASGSKSGGMTKANLAAQMSTSVAATEPVENEYADITALLADQGNQTTSFLQYVVDASDDPNIVSGEAYYEKKNTSTATLADDYRLLSDTEVTVVTDSNSYRVFRIQAIQDDGTPLTTVGGGRISFEYSGANVTAILFNARYTDAIAEFYGKDVNVRFYNRTTRKYQTEAVASTTWTTVNTNYYRAAITGTNIQIADLTVNDRVEFFIVEGTSSAGGGDLAYQTEITTNTTLDGTQKGLNKVYPVNNTAARTITITTGDYVANDVINIERRGQGSVEIIADTGVRIRGVRDGENRYFINDVNSMVALLCRGSEEFGIIGNLKRGYSGAVTTSSYGALREGDTAVDVTVIATGFSENMLVTVSANATQSSAFTYVSSTEITLHLTAVGVEDDTVTVTYDNGDVFVDTDAITILTDDESLYASHPFEVGYALFQLNGTITYGIRVRRSSDDAETDVGFDTNKKVSLSSLVSAGGDLTTWAGSDDVFITKRYNQGSLGSTYDQVQSTPANQPKFLNAGALISLGSQTWMEFDGTNDYLATSSSNDWASGDFTVFCNARIAVSQNGTLFSCYASNSDRLFYLRYKSSSTKFNWITGNLGGISTEIEAASNASLDTNYKVAAYRNASTVRCYMDGVGGTSDAAPDSYETASAPLETGDISPLGTQLFDGYLNYSVYYSSDESANIATIETIIDTFL